MPKTSLRLKLSIWGTNLDLDSLAGQLPVPSWTSRVGDGRGEYAKNKAGWGWTSQESNADIREILANFLELFSPHQGLLQQSVESGAEVTLSVSGVIEVGIVDSPEEADRRQYEMPEPFVPFSDADRLALFFDAATLRFLSSISASLQTYIDIELERKVADG